MHDSYTFSIILAFIMTLSVAMKLFEYYLKRQNKKLIKKLANRNKVDDND